MLDMLEWIMIGLQIVLLILAYFFTIRIFYIILSFNNVVPYVPTPNGVVRKMIHASGILDDSRYHIRIMDLGSGTGKMVFRIAKHTPESVTIYGIERSTLLYTISKLRYHFSRHKKRIVLLKGSWDDIHVAQFDYFFLFVTTRGLKALYPKFAHEVKKQARIVSYLFGMPPNGVFLERKVTWGMKERIFGYCKKS